MSIRISRANSLQARGDEMSDARNVTQPDRHHVQTSAGGPHLGQVARGSGDSSVLLVDAPHGLASDTDAAGSSVESERIPLGDEETQYKFRSAMRAARSYEDWVPRSSRGYSTLKRLLDVAVSASVLVLAVPLFVWTAWRIRCEDGGPVFFRQTRVGRGGRHFTCVKFRSMLVDAERQQDELAAESHHGLANKQTFKIKLDPRCTRIGRFIRRTSIDELPQLWNVLRGEMSLVGPRPPLPKEVAWYETRHMKRLAAKPGLTCIWQISGRGDIPFEKQVDLDVRYIERQGWWLDLSILVKTIPAVLSRRGAY